MLLPMFDAVVAALALAEGFVFAPLDPSLTLDEYQRYLKRIDASTLVVPDDFPSPARSAAVALGVRVARPRGHEEDQWITVRILHHDSALDDVAAEFMKFYEE